MKLLKSLLLLPLLLFSVVGADSSLLKVTKIEVGSKIGFPKHWTMRIDSIEDEKDFNIEFNGCGKYTSKGKLESDSENILITEHFDVEEESCPLYEQSLVPALKLILLKGAVISSEGVDLIMTKDSGKITFVI